MTEDELARIAAETGLCSRCGRMTADLVAEVRRLRKLLFTFTGDSVTEDELARIEATLYFAKAATRETITKLIAEVRRLTDQWEATEAELERVNGVLTTAEVELNETQDERRRLGEQLDAALAEVARLKEAEHRLHLLSKKNQLEGEEKEGSEY